MAIISNAVTMADAGAFSASLGAMTLIKTITVSSNTATVNFIHGSNSVVFDSTYPVYLLRVVNIHNDQDDKNLGHTLPFYLFECQFSSMGNFLPRIVSYNSLK